MGWTVVTVGKTSGKNAVEEGAMKGLMDREVWCASSNRRRAWGRSAVSVTTCRGYVPGLVGARQNASWHARERYVPYPVPAKKGKGRGVCRLGGSAGVIPVAS